MAKIFFMLCFCVAAYAQTGKDTIAVYVTGDLKDNEKKVVNTEMLDALVKNKRYTAVERSDVFLAKVAEEHKKQRGGSVDDKQISELGKQFGVQFVCVADVTKVKDSYLVSARIIDVETAQVDKMGKAYSHLESEDDLKDVSERVVTSMFGDGITDVEMVFVKGGSFVMGCNGESNDCIVTEKPTQKVTVDDFYIGKYEVTQKLWKHVMGGVRSIFGGDDMLPVFGESWNDVQTFIARLSAITGKSYRLPTEAEWEYAARGGTASRGYKYAGSNNIEDVAWYYVNSGNKVLIDYSTETVDRDNYVNTVISNENRVHPVGTKQPNELGIHDMSGNVYEWVSDWHDHYSYHDKINPKGPSSGTKRVYRGGNYNSNSRSSRVFYRLGGDPDKKNMPPGFRLAYAQSDGLKPKIAVYVTGDLKSTENKALGTKMLDALVKSGRYTAVERSDAFLAKVAEEHKKQRSGSVDEKKIRELGKQFGVQFICVADITEAFGSYQISARIIDIETAVVSITGKAYSKLKSSEEFTEASTKVVASMFGWITE